MRCHQLVQASCKSENVRHLPFLACFSIPEHSFMLLGYLEILYQDVCIIFLLLFYWLIWLSLVWVHFLIGCKLLVLLVAMFMWLWALLV
jgi:hypothetical protein